MLFLYGPLSAILILSFQGPDGGLTFPLNGVSRALVLQSLRKAGGRRFRRLLPALVHAGLHGDGGHRGGLAARGPGLPPPLPRRRRCCSIATVASLVVPSIIISLGIGVVFQQVGLQPAWYSSAFGAHLTWTLPFGVLIMFAVFNRFSPAYEEAARDLGASSWQTFRHVVLPMIAPSLIGVGLFGFTLSYDEFARTLMTSGSYNTLPLEIYGMTTNVTTPVLYALGTVTTLFSFTIILVALGIMLMLRRRQAKIS